MARLLFLIKLLPYIRPMPYTTDKRFCQPCCFSLPSALLERFRAKTQKGERSIVVQKAIEQYLIGIESKNLV